MAIILAPVMVTTSCTLPGAGCAVQPPWASSQNGAASQGATSQRAFEILSCRAIAGDKSAQVSLGRAYETGVGRPQDMKMAVDWYQRAARSSRRPERIDMTPVDNQTHGWINKRVPKGEEVPGDTWAQFRLGEIYLAGNGVRQSDRRAAYWLKRAALSDYAPAIALLARMEAGEE